MQKLQVKSDGLQVNTPGPGGAETDPEIRLPGKSSETDPLGSYTGVPEEKREKPTQDADDL